ncbi:MAG TPA: ShlB/FhaC/HecB family hemolysin secretion/activation protein [Stellaceae bacterium]|nr:ShlB/FhaC/HecB family hemolysin secretion/activation protein [Stellaceae bacterium]
MLAGSVLRVSRSVLGVILAAAWLIGGASGIARAQQSVAPSRVTPESLRPAAPAAPTIEVPGGAPVTAPAGAAGLSIVVGQVSVGGTFPGFEGTTAGIVGPLAGKRMSVAEIYAAADAIERAYAAAGYILARVVVPPQQLADGGTVRLQVVDGTIERVDVSAVPERQRAVVAARMAGVVGEPRLMLSDIERRLLLVSDLPGLQLKSTLAAGPTPGGTLLVIEATQALVSGSVGVDDRLPKALGTWTLNSTGAINDALGFGEQVYASYSTSPDVGSPRLRVMGGGVVLPLGNDGFTLNPEYTESIAKPIPAPGTPATTGDFKRFALRASYPLVRSRAETLTLSGTAEWDDETLTAIGFGTRLYEDDYAAGRFGVHDLIELPWGAIAMLDGTYSHGLTGRSGTTLLPLSQQGASSIFNKLVAVASLRQPLPEAFELDLIGHAQTSFGAPLMLSEQFGLDGPDALSGFASGTFSVDQGLTLRAEFARPFALSLGALGGMPPLGLSPYVFGAFGYGQIVQPTAVQKGSIDAGSAGIGIRSTTVALTTGLPVGSTLGLELARRFSDVPGVRGGYRANLALNLTF